jgi:hypothetical protein
MNVPGRMVQSTQVLSAASSGPHGLPVVNSEKTRTSHSPRAHAYLWTLVVLALLCPSWAAATPVDYNITFTLLWDTNSLAAPTGDFTYDPTAANGFSNFLVSWDGHTFDLTNAANHPLVGGSPGPCDPTGLSNAASSFYILNNPGACNSIPQYTVYWYAFFLVGNPTPIFRFYADSPPGDPDYIEIDTSSAGGASTISAGGTWQILAQTSGVPEPSSGLLLCLGGAVLGLRRWRGARRIAP